MFFFNYQKVRTCCFIYISLPLLVFSIGYLRWYWALVACAFLFFAFAYAVKYFGIDSNHLDTISISKREMFSLFLFLLLFTHLCGINGYWFQTSDWHARNPIFHDLIFYDWPVYYANKGSALSYYIGSWLVPAIPAKIAVTLFGRFGWGIGRISLWLWSTLGLYLISLLLFIYCKAKSLSRRITVLLVFLFFSGLDIIGVWYTGARNYFFSPDVLHLEWWTSFQFSSITTCVCWVFNQSIIPWLCTILVLFEKDCRNYLLIGVGCILCGPFPFVGLVIIMVTKAVSRMLTAKASKQNWGTILRPVLSSANIFLLVSIFPILACFLLTNNAASDGIVTDAPATAASLALLHQISYTLRSALHQGLILCYLLEVGIYLILLHPWHRKDVLYYVIAFSLMVIPTIRVGVSNDFCMRVSIPCIFVIMIWCAERLVDWMDHPRFCRNRRFRIRLIGLVIALLIGAVTPCVELYRGIYHVIDSKTIFLQYMPYDSLGRSSGISYNFETTNARNQFFFKYFAKDLE